MNGLRLPCLPGRAACGILGEEHLFLIQKGERPDACTGPFR